VHSKGLKFGIHIMRGIPKIALKKIFLFDSSATAKDIYSERLLCRCLVTLHRGSGRRRTEYYNSLFSLYAAWGVTLLSG